MKSSYQDFEETLSHLLAKARKSPISIDTFLTVLSGKGKVLLLIFLSLGFGQIPGVAFFLGLLIVYLGFRIAIGNTFIWMPKIIRRKKIPSYFLVKVMKQLLRFLKFMKRWSYPRYVWATRKRGTRIANGFMLALVGACFAMSPPIPLVGWIAFSAIFLIAIGLLNDDGVYIIMGYACSLFYLVIVLCLLKYCSFSQICGWVKCLISS